MYNVNWNKLSRLLTPLHWRSEPQLSWMDALMVGVRNMYSRFLDEKKRLDYLSNYNEQILTLTKLLNDKWDLFNRLIYIDNVADLSRVYLYQKVEVQSKTYLYSKWKSGFSYLAGHCVQEGFKIYQANHPNINLQPSTNPSAWEYIKDGVYLRTKLDYTLYPDFIVYVPTYVTFDINEMKRTINQYKFAGLTYSIQTYIA